MLQPIIIEDSDYDTLPGDVRLRRGDIVKTHGQLYIVDYANESNAKVVSLERKAGKERETLAGKKFQILESNQVMRISTCVGRHLLVERRGENGWQEFIAAKKVSRRGIQQTTGDDERSDDMKNNTEAKGGLAASAKARKAKEATEKEPSTGALGGYLGHSVTSVLVTMGKADISTPWATAICKELKLKASPASISIFTSAGRAVANKELGHKELLDLNTKRGKGAPLTIAEIKTLKDAATEPEPEPTAAEKKATKDAEKAAKKAEKDAAKAAEAGK